MWLESSMSTDKQNALIDELSENDLLIIGLHDMSQYSSKNFGLTEDQIQLVNALSQKMNVVLAVFGNPYSLQYFDQVDCVVMAYQEGTIYEDLAAQAIFGGIGFQGRLPVTASDRSTFNSGVFTPSNIRFGYSSPERVGMISDSLQLIDELAAEAISKGATPGCVVLVAKDNRIVFEKAYGHYTYSRQKKMKTDAIFDVASITKVASSSLAVMKLQDEGTD